MSLTFESFVSRINPNHNISLKRAPMALLHSHSSSAVRFEALRRPNSQRIYVAPRRLSPKGLGADFLALNRRSSKSRCVVSSAASHEDSKHSEIEVEQGKSNAEVGAKESQEAWKQMLESLKEQMTKMQGMSEEAYEVYSRKALVILKEASEELKVQAEKTRQYSSTLATEISIQGKEYLSIAAEKSPEVKDIVETFGSSTDDVKEATDIQDFHIGIPYGAILSLGGFLFFMLTGTTSAIRFGVILGGTLLALSLSSLRSWKRKESSSVALKGQAAIAAVIFLRELSLLSQRSSLWSYLTTLISGAVVAFYLYRIKIDVVPRKGPSLGHRPES